MKEEDINEKVKKWLNSKVQRCKGVSTLFLHEVNISCSANTTQAYYWESTSLCFYIHVHMNYKKLNLSLLQRRADVQSIASRFSHRRTFVLFLVNKLNGFRTIYDIGRNFLICLGEIFRTWNQREIIEERCHTLNMGDSIL